jgi:hypothetical protein
MEENTVAVGKEGGCRDAGMQGYRALVISSTC